MEEDKESRMLEFEIDHHSRFCWGLHPYRKVPVRIFIPQMGEDVFFYIKRMYLPSTDEDTFSMFAGDYVAANDMDNRRTFVAMCLDPGDGNGERITFLGKKLTEKELSLFMDSQLELNSRTSKNGELA